MASDDSLICPQCGMALRIVELVAPPEQKLKTRNTVAAGGFGAVAGGVLGAPAGPAGAAAGATIGAGLLGSAAASGKQEVRAECSVCQEDHHVLVDEDDIPPRLTD